MKKLILMMVVGVLMSSAFFSRCYADDNSKLAKESKWSTAVPYNPQLHDFNNALNTYRKAQEVVWVIAKEAGKLKCEEVKAGSGARSSWLSEISIHTLDCEALSGKYTDLSNREDTEDVTFANGQVQEVSKKIVLDDGFFFLFTYRFDGSKIFVRGESPDKKESVSYEMNVSDGIPRVTAASLSIAKDLPQDKLPALLNLLYETNFKKEGSEIDGEIKLLIYDQKSQERFPKWAADKISKGLI